MKKDEELEYGRRLLAEEGKASAFHIAAANSWLHILRWLLDEEAVDINSQPRRHNKETALHAAAGLGLKKVAEFLIARGADLNRKDGYDFTPLMKACNWESKKMSAVALLLIEAGADVHHVRKSDGASALSCARACAEPAVIKALKRAGAKV